MRIILRLLGFLKPYTGWVVLSIVLSLTTIASNIGLLGTSAYLIARAAQHPSIAELQIAIVGVRFFGILRGLGRYFERLVSHSVNFHLLSRLRVWFFQKLEPLAPARTQMTSSGDLLSQAIADIDTLQEFFVRVVAPPVTAALVTAGMGLYLGIFDPMLGLLVLAGLIICGMLLPFTARRLSDRISLEIITHRSKFSAMVAEFLDGLVDILTLDMTDRKLSELKDMSRLFGEFQVKFAWRGALISSLNVLITNLTFWLVVLFAIPLVTLGRLDGVNFVVIALIVLASFEAVTPLGLAAQNMQQALPAAARIFALVDQEPAVIDPVGQGRIAEKPDVVIRNLTFNYPGTHQEVLQKVSLDLPFGKRIAVVGESGSGKSTLFALLERFWDCPTGSIFIGGTDIRNFALSEVYKKLAFLEQGGPLIAGTVQDNLLLGKPEASEEQVLTAVREAGLEGWLNSLPKGLNTWIGERGARISGGEKQRIAIARTFLQDTPIWLLDEPLNHLDQDNARQVFDRIIEKSKNRSLILATHTLDFLDRVDEIFVIKAGRIVEFGTHNYLMAQKGEYARLWGTNQSEPTS